MSTFNPGDKVKIVRKGESNSVGFQNTWVSDMDKRVGDGKVYEVSRVSSAGITLRSSAGSGVSYAWPPDALELVSSLGAEVDKALALLRQHGTVNFIPKFKTITVQLNSEHEAVVHENFVKVGCQKFSFSAVLALAEAVQKVKAQLKQ